MPKYIETRHGYHIYRDIVTINGEPHGRWYAEPTDHSEPIFPISYDQALGYEPLPKEPLSVTLGRILLPKKF